MRIMTCTLARTGALTRLMLAGLLSTCAQAATIETDLDDLGLAAGSYDNGSDGRGGFHSRNVLFRNSYNADWGSWAGIAASRVCDTNTAGWNNQYAVWTPGRDRSGNGAYAVVYDDAGQEADVIELPYDCGVKGFYVNNTTYAALSMRDGDAFAKKFGGASGHDEDWFKLTVTGRDAAGALLGTVACYLADFRFADHARDYILGEWRWLDLSSLGSNVRTLHFALSSSDNGTWGMNTPAFFAMDDLQIVPTPSVLKVGLDGLPSGQAYWNGADGTGAWVDQAVRFGNVYNAEWGSWSGVALSRVNDTTTAGWANQYAVWTPGTDQSGSGNYAIVYDDAWDPEADTITFPHAAWVKGFYVNNTTYAALTMRDGDWSAKKFGGATGNDADWFKLTVTARNAAGTALGTKAVYLADYRFADNSKDFILGEWTWVDLAGIGPDVKTLHFALSSSDNGAWGMNTPAYFALDGLTYVYSFSNALADDNRFDAGIPGFVGPGGIGKTGGGNVVNPVFAAWASGVASYAPAAGVGSSWIDTGKTLGAVSGDHTHVASLGDLDATQLAAGTPPGQITLTFATPIADRQGADFVAFENAYLMSGTANIFGEFGFVEVSSDGANFARFPSVSLATNTVGPYAGHDVRTAYNLVGKHANAYGSTWGTPFDLGDLACHPLVQAGTVVLTNITHVRIVDIPGKGTFQDSFTPPNAIYDPWHTWGSGGVDLEAIGVINSPVAARIEVTVTGPGSVSPYGYPGGLVSVLHGGTRAFTIVPAAGYHVADVLVDGVSVGATNGYTFANVRRDHTLEARFGSRLTVHSPHGIPVPAAGARVLESGTAVTAMLADAIVTLGTTQYVCTGWAGAGSVSPGGAGTATGFTITNDSTLAWLWQTNYWFERVTVGRGSVDVAAGWRAAGSALTATAQPDPYYAFTGWSGDTQGDPGLPTMTVAMDHARALTATFWAEETARGVPVSWLDVHGLSDEDDDGDGDNEPAWREFYAGTDPDDPTSRFTIIAVTRGQGTNTVTWLGGTNGSALPFDVLAAPRMTGPWSAVPGVTARSPCGTNAWRGAVSGDEPVFYRIRVSGVP